VFINYNNTEYLLNVLEAPVQVIID